MANFVVVSDLEYVWDVIFSICSKALRQVIRRMSSKFSNFAEPNPKEKWLKTPINGYAAS